MSEHRTNNGYSKFEMEVAERLSKIETKIDGITTIKAVVDEHERQISFWKGATAVLYMLFIGVCGALGIHFRKVV